MPITNATIGGVPVYQISGVVTNADFNAAWGGLISNNVYLLQRSIYVAANADMSGVTGGYVVNLGNRVDPGIILHQDRDLEKTVFNNFTFIHTVGLRTADRFNLIQIWTGSTLIIAPETPGLSQDGGGYIYAVVGNAGGSGDTRFLSAPFIGNISNVYYGSQPFAEQELIPNTKVNGIWRAVNFQRAFGFPELGLLNQRFIVFRSNMNTEDPAQQLVRANRGSAACYVSSYITRNGQDVTSGAVTTFPQADVATVVVLNNFTRESWFGQSKTVFAVRLILWNAASRVIGGVLKRLEFVDGAGGVVKCYDSRSTSPQRCLFQDDVDTATAEFTDPNTTPTVDAQGRIQLVHVGAIATGGDAAITRYTGQQYTFQKYGKRILIGQPDMTDGDTDISAFNLILLQDQAFVTRTQSEVEAATEVTTLQELVEEVHNLAVGLSGPDSYNGAFTGNLFDVSGSTFVADFSKIVIDPNAAQKIVYNSTTNILTVRGGTVSAIAGLDTIRATEVVGDLDGVDVEGTWRTQLPVTLTGRRITKLIVDGGTGDISLTNCDIGEIENQSGTDASVFLTGTPAPTLTETNGTLNVATSITFNDAAGGDFTLLVINPADNSVVRAYDPTPAGTYLVDAGARSQLRIAAYKRGHYTLVRTFDISGDATFPLVFTVVPFVDMGEDVEAIKNDLTTAVIANPYPGINALVRGTFASPHAELSQNQFKRVFVDFQGRQDVMELLAEFNFGAIDLFASTSTGINILRPAFQFAVAGDFEVNTLAFVDTTAAVALAADYTWNPENASNRKVISAPVPILLQSNLGLDGGSGGAGGATAQEIWSFPTRTLTSGGGSGGVTLAEIEASEVLAKEASVQARPTLAEMEASAALTAVADVSGLATETSVTALGTPLQAGDYIVPPSLADIEGSTVLAKEASIAGLSSAVGTPLQAGDYTAPPTSADNATAVWSATIRSLTDKDGFGLTATERQSVATVVEAALLDDSDGQALLEAIVQAIGNQNVDEIALVAAIRADLERAGGTTDQTLKAAKLAASLSA